MEKFSKSSLAIEQKSERDKLVQIESFSPNTPQEKSILSNDSSNQQDCEGNFVFYDQKVNKNIMKRVSLKKKLHKITNSPKHYIREFVHKWRSCNVSAKQKVILIGKEKFLKRKLRQGNIGLQVLKKLLGNTNPQEEDSKFLRQLMRKILRKDECGNDRINYRLSYLIANRVFALRCREERLISRNKIY